MSTSETGSIRALVERLTANGVHFAIDGTNVTIRAPAGVLDAASAQRLRSSKAELIGILAEESRLGLSLAPTRISRDTPVALGLVQQRIWLHGQLEPEVPLYSLPAAWKIHGPLDVVRLETAIRGVIERHEVLRSRILLLDGKPVTRFESSESWSLKTVDADEACCGPESGSSPQARLFATLESLRDEPFNLESDWPFKAALVRQSGHDPVLFWMPHHAVWDGASFDIFLRDLSALYVPRDTSAELPPLPYQYADYAHWHRSWLASPIAGDQLTRALSALKRPVPTLELPAEQPRPLLFSPVGDWHQSSFGPRLMQKVHAVATRYAVTSAMTFLAAWIAFLHRITGQTDFVIGVPAQARTRADSVDLIGCFVNTLCIRVNFGADVSFEDLLLKVKEACLVAYDSQDAPIEVIAERVTAANDRSRPPLFQTMFSHQDVRSRAHDLGGLGLEQIHVNPAATPVELMLGVMEGRESARVVLHYSAGLFPRETISDWARWLERLVLSALQDPSSPVGALSFLAEGDLERLQRWGGRPRPVEDALTHVLDRVAHMAGSYPSRTAIRTLDVDVSYGELYSRSSAFAHKLLTAGVQRGDLVGVSLERSADTVVTILGIWAAGGAYVPLDPEFPQDRLDYMVSDSGAKLIVTDDANRWQRGATPILVVGQQGSHSIGLPESTSLPAIEPTGLAYVLYTSGSTGRPKGVEIEHRSVSNLLSSMKTRPGFSDQDSLLALTTLSFDISVLELFLPLYCGGKVVIVSADDAKDGARLAEHIAREGITMMQATPATWRLLLSAGWGGPRKIRALCGGEALPSALALNLLERCVEVWNMYGPTETTVWSTCARVRSAEDVVIGEPIAETTLYVLDDEGNRVAPGVFGELWIGGAGVARGYRGRPDLTSERFVPDRFSSDPSARLYRTGDWVRFGRDGQLRFGTRRDAQVKVRGFRIEIGEIENALATHPAVEVAAVSTFAAADGEKALACHLQLKIGARVTPTELRRHLRKTLPEYMVPQLFQIVPCIPLTPNGKIDRNALVVAASTEGLAVRSIVGPANETQALMVKIWKELLRSEQVSATDNFFDLGGHSLLAAQMIARLVAEGGPKLSARAVIFDSLEQLEVGARGLRSAG